MAYNGMHIERDPEALPTPSGPLTERLHHQENGFE
jgi:hypothetical protein